MKCPECGQEKPIEEWGYRGYCIECDIKRRTCDVCREIVVNAALVWMNTEKGQKGHRECIKEGETQ